jgi:hypothetical protein
VAAVVAVAVDATSIDVIRGVSAELLKSCSVVVLPHSLSGSLRLAENFPCAFATFSLADSMRVYVCLRTVAAKLL